MNKLMLLKETIAILEKSYHSRLDALVLCIFKSTFKEELTAINKSNFLSGEVNNIKIQSKDLVLDFSKELFRFYN